MKWENAPMSHNIDCLLKELEAKPDQGKPALSGHASEGGPAKVQRIK